MEVDAVNQAMDRSAWPANRMMRVAELAEAAAILQSSGVREGGMRRRVKRMALDCKAYNFAVKYYILVLVSWL